MVQNLPIPNDVADELFRIDGVESLGSRGGALVVSVTDPSLEDRVLQFLDERGIDIPVEIEEIDGIFPISRLARQRPVPMGVGISHEETGGGTSSWTMVSDSGELFVSSNRHVIAPLGDAFPFDPILQPATIDGGTAPDDTVARLEGWVTPETGFESDFAWAKPVDDYDDLFTNTFFGGGEPTRHQNLPIEEDRAVYKEGSISGLTEGQILESNVSVTGSDEVPRMDNQFTISAFVTSGDSGSPVYGIGEGGRLLPAGIVWGVITSGGEFVKALCSPADSIEEESGLTIYSLAYVPDRVESTHCNLTPRSFKEDSTEPVTGVVTVENDNEFDVVTEVEWLVDGELLTVDPHLLRDRVVGPNSSETFGVDLPPGIDWPFPPGEYPVETVVSRTERS